MNIKVLHDDRDELSLRANLLGVSVALDFYLLLFDRQESQLFVLHGDVKAVAQLLGMVLDIVTSVSLAAEDSDLKFV